MSLSLLSPYLSSGHTWLRGNLHAHTTHSDGKMAPEAVIASYEERGYDFLAISDHDYFLPPAAFQSTTRMTLIGAQEITALGPHMLAVGIDHRMQPDPDRQANIDAVIARGGLAILNHPRWQRDLSHYSIELLQRLTGYTGIEVYNGVIERDEGNALAADVWDVLLSAERVAWGFVNDDFHRDLDMARGWNMVQAEDRSVPAILEAFRRGRFYGTTGVSITDIRVDGPTVTIEAGAERIRFVSAWGRELTYANSPAASYTLTGQEAGYVRAECLGRAGRCAWTQPFRIRTGE